jgi:hypothetical protein
VTTGHDVFVLSPANTEGRRAQFLIQDDTTNDIADALRGPAGASLGDVFTFMSQLYFRGKRSYAEHFANPPAGTSGVLVIVPGYGLLDVNTRIAVADLRAIACVDVDRRQPRFRNPFVRDVKRLDRRLTASDRVVFLGSVATDKYLDILSDGLGERLFVPESFAGRGSMSRGALLLRCVAADAPLSYLQVSRDALTRQTVFDASSASCESSRRSGLAP